MPTRPLMVPLFRRCDRRVVPAAATARAESRWCRPPLGVVEEAAGSEHGFELRAVVRSAVDPVTVFVDEVLGEPVGGGARSILDAGRDIRLANRAQRRALRYRHARHCAFPGCDAPIDWCEAHHIIEWDDEGNTNMANLVPLCRYHHHKVHEGGFTLARDPGTATWHTYRPGGTEILLPTPRTTHPLQT